MLRAIILASILFPIVPIVWAQETAPPLTIDTLYHPKNRHKYIESPSPATRWISQKDGSPILLIRRDEQWMQLDPLAVEEGLPAPETIWPGSETLVAQLLSLGDIDQDKAKSVVAKWVGSPAQSLHSALVRIDDAIAIAGLDETPRWITRQAARWHDPTLSPDGKFIAFVQDNDLYIMTVESGRLIRVTDDGSPTRFNGRLDWVYQEEIFGRGDFKGFWWSDDSRSIALMRLDNSHVHAFTIATSDGARGGALVERYPKAGDPSTTAELWVANLSDTPEEQVSLDPVFLPNQMDQVDDDSLIVRVGWRGESRELIFSHTNRLQNELFLWRYDTSAGRLVASMILRENGGQWLEVIDLPHWLQAGDFLWQSDLPTGRRRLWRVSSDGNRRVPLTPGDFDVRELVAVDEERGIAWVSGDWQRGTVGQHLYQVELSGQPESSPTLIRLTGDLPWHSVSLSDDHRWMVDRASGLTQPTRTALVPLDRLPAASDADAVKEVDKPARLWQLHQEQLVMPGDAIEPIWETITTADGLELPAYVYPPAGAKIMATGERAQAESNRGSSDRYPVLIEVYGGPLAPSVRDAWSTTRYLFHQFLASQGIGVMVVDNRSSGGRGLADAWSIHRRVGEMETQDLVTAARWLGTRDWVDSQKIGVRGWSFGGFLTLHAMTHSDLFAAGVAGGSVTDWRNYDSIYTERYMGLPTENAAGYEATSPIAAAANLSGRVLLVHGEIDDNVHLANTLQMAAALQEAGKPFEMMIYPGSGHGVADAMQVYHLMLTTFSFLERELGNRDH